MRKPITLALIFLAIGIAGGALAHQPRLVSDRTNIEVEEPEISKAYYGQLSDNSVVYQIEAEQPFGLYVNLLVPAIDNAKKDFIIEIRKNGVLLDMLNGRSYAWTDFYEPYARDRYFKGPEFKQEVGPGDYEIEIFNADYDGRYVLAIGQEEKFGIKEIIKTAYILPVIKVVFFDKSPLVSLFNLSGLILVGLILIIFILILIIKKILKSAKEKKDES
ncbi:MAG: hypothetical protein ABH889_03320 [Candidatus Portnoybacteria bacterium]